MKTKRKWLKDIALLQILNVIFSLDGVLIKLASMSWAKDGFFAISTIGYLVLAVGILGVYALAWQVILGRVDLSIAYINKGTVVIWVLVWAILFFGESINIFNIIGAIFILGGLIFVNY